MTVEPAASAEGKTAATSSDAASTRPKRAPRTRKKAEGADSTAHVEEVTTAVAQELAQLTPKARKPRVKKTVDISLDAVEESKERATRKTSRQVATRGSRKTVSSDESVLGETMNESPVPHGTGYDPSDIFSAAQQDSSVVAGRARVAVTTKGSTENGKTKRKATKTAKVPQEDFSAEIPGPVTFMGFSVPETSSAQYSGPQAPIPLGGMTDLLFQEPDTSKVRARTKAASSSLAEETGQDKNKRVRASRTPSKESEPAVLEKAEQVPEESELEDNSPDSPGEDSFDTLQELEPRRRRRGTRGRRRTNDEQDNASYDSASEGDDSSTDTQITEEEEGTRRRRRRNRERSESSNDEVSTPRGSTRLEAKRQRRREGREAGRRRHTISESEYLARRESVKREMLVREQDGLNQIAVLEDDVLVEHYVARHTQVSMVGNVYLGRVQNVLPSMEAAFVDIGKGRNAVLYAGEVNWEAAGMSGQPRRIEQALKSGDAVLVQVTKDPIGHKGARLTAQITLAGRHLVLVPGGAMTGISRKLPDRERQRLKKLLREIVPPEHGVIVRTAAEGASEEQLRADVERLTKSWDEIQKKAKNTKSAPSLLKGEPELAVRVVRDIFNEDFQHLKVQGDAAWNTISGYVAELSPELTDRVFHWTDSSDIFAQHRVDEQLAKAFDRKVWLPSGGTLVIDRTEAMTVIDVNTGKFTGTGGTLEETVTRNNLEAAEEIVRQLRLRDIGGIIVVDFIDMVLEANRELVLRRLIECLGRDRTRHQVAEVTSLGLVQMTRKRVGQGLVEAFSTSCEACEGRGYITHTHPVERPDGDNAVRRKNKQQSAKEVDVLPSQDDPKHEEVRAALTSIAAAAASKHEEKLASEGSVNTQEGSAQIKAEARLKTGTRRGRGMGATVENVSDGPSEGVDHEDFHEDAAFAAQGDGVCVDGEADAGHEVQENAERNDSVGNNRSVKRSVKKGITTKGARQRGSVRKTQEVSGQFEARGKDSPAVISSKLRDSRTGRDGRAGEETFESTSVRSVSSKRKKEPEGQLGTATRKRRVSSSGTITPKSTGVSSILSFPAG